MRDIVDIVYEEGRGKRDLFEKTNMICDASLVSKITKKTEKGERKTGIKNEMKMSAETCYLRSLDIEGKAGIIFQRPEMLPWSENFKASFGDGRPKSGRVPFA